MKPKTGKLEICAYNVRCPHCQEALPNPADGSHVWDASYPYKVRNVKCSDCGAIVAVPKRFR
jgi:ribosomal protein S27E